MAPVRVFVFVFAFAACASTPRVATPTHDNKALVLEFYELALNGGHPADAFARYAAPGFVEHSQDSPGGTARGTIEFLAGLIAKSPQGHWDVVRAIAEGELVFVHARYVPAPGGPEVAIAEIFRVHDHKLVEHWDVISGPPDKVVNPNARF